ncbi:MAG: phosphotransferase [Actinomycetaceae bacterium]|nr:phosphotransferase [Actinomycetaceae bacterium]
MEGLGAAIAPWLDGCRWFAGGRPRVERAIELTGPWPATVLWLVVAAGGTRYNVPVVVDGARVVDAAGEPSGQRAILALACASEPIAARGFVSRQAAGGLPAMTEAWRLDGEQSNTSIVYLLADSSRVIVKIFRVAEPGANPDIALQRILSDTGTVPRVHGWVRLTEDDAASTPGKDGGASTPGGFDVAIAQEFLAGASDGWRVVTARLSNAGPDGAPVARAPEPRADGTARQDGTPHKDRAGRTRGRAAPGDLRSITRLGGLTRRIHRHLAQRCPTSAPDAAARHDIAAAWSRRAERTLAIFPQLEPWRATIERTYARALDATWPHLQAIHGDFHLGQVLSVPGRGWVAIDFEGEPLRPLAERTTPDLALRDVAGMLRSFGYAAGSAKLRGADPAAMDAWEAAARSAFLEGYNSPEGFGPAAEGHGPPEGYSAPSPAGGALLDALILDKALYELAYEASRRPDWIPIPLLGVARLLAIGDTQCERLLTDVDVSHLTAQPMEE